MLKAEEKDIVESEAGFWRIPLILENASDAEPVSVESLRKLGVVRVPGSDSALKFTLGGRDIDRPRSARIFLRLTVSENSREQKQVKVRIPGSGEVIGTIEVGYGCPLQPFELEISHQDLPRIIDSGVELYDPGEDTPLEIFSGRPLVADDLSAFAPHVLLGGARFDPEPALLDAVHSLRSLAPFGWEEGCLTDALWQMSLREGGPASRQALIRRFEAIGAMDRDWDVGDTMHSIESTLPFAALANLDPDHPVLKKVEKFWDSKLRDNGVIADYSATAEGSYTVAYPMAVLSRLWNRPDLAERSLEQLRLRKKALAVGDDIYLRQNPESGSRSFRNWSRGVTWYLLGLQRSLSVLGDEVDASDLKEEFARVVQICLKRQLPNGLWSCYIDAPEIVPDTAGSSGIAAAIASGVEAGMLSRDCAASLPRTWNSLMQFVTVDGLLNGVAQSNKGGEALQRSDYRVLMAMGLGLLVQLHASLREIF